jgi:hypothetical protein
MPRFVYDAMDIWIFLAKFIKMDENFTQSKFKLVKFKFRNTTNYTLKHEI